MPLRQLYDHASSTYSYLLWDGESRKAALIDPVQEQFPRDCELLEQLQLELCLVLETHIHADHITSAGLFRERYGCRIGLHEKAGSRCADLALHDGQKLQLGSLVIEALYTPGHTDTDICYQVNDWLFSGDTLLIRGSGRTDFQSGDPGMAWDSIQRLLQLPDETLIYPAHDYRGLSCSTIGEERRFNPRLAGVDRDQFIALMNGMELDPPAQIERALPGNLACGLPSEPEKPESSGPEPENSAPEI